ncbi:hypothetical protein ABZ135_09135 [Streptomyces sp. NPDC006339]|uniref:hypothetical protein n=1 Tax=Streptomyces sp. NPDC006339 TaxID=3156755 RepID=UPI0033A431FC
MRKLIATVTLAAAAVLAGSGSALAHSGGGEFFAEGPDVVVVDHTVVVCGDFSICQGDGA